jgi:hypothetical protein
VDLAQAIETSNYFQNIVKRAAAGESSRRLITDLEEFLDRDTQAVWENSWVRLPLRTLTPFASEVLHTDLLADKASANDTPRSDAGRFFIEHHGEPFLRVPVSYLLKLSLAQAVSADPHVPDGLRMLGCDLMSHFLNDNSSPETFSFSVVSLTPEARMGAAIAKETARRFLLTQLLVLYANECFSLGRTGQRAIVYFAPHPPVRQKHLNGLIPDSFYRELFMNPCLSGWNRGEEKLRYMHLCHEVMSRSQLNAVIRLKDAGIISRNLASCRAPRISVWPTTGRISALAVGCSPTGWNRERPDSARRRKSTWATWSSRSSSISCPCSSAPTARRRIGWTSGISIPRKRWASYRMNWRRRT